MSLSTISPLIRVVWGGAVLAFILPAAAQGGDTEGEAAKTLDAVVVVGSQIVGSNVAGALPVTVLDAADIEATGAVSGDEFVADDPADWLCHLQ